MTDSSEGAAASERLEPKSREKTPLMDAPAWSGRRTGPRLDGRGSPTPRTVWISRSRSPPSIFLRRALMYTSMMFVERSKESSQMRAWISERETTLPRRRRRSSKRAPSRTVRRTVSPSRVTSRDSGSYERSSKTSGPGGTTSVRRRRAPACRARSSRKEKGLTR